MNVALDEKGWPVDRAALIGKEFVHFKGKRYQILDFASDSETQELMVVYRTLYGAMDHWVRPAKMFFETVERDGYSGPRFRLAEGPEARGGEAAGGGPLRKDGDLCYNTHSNVIGG